MNSVCQKVIWAIYKEEMMIVGTLNLNFPDIYRLSDSGDDENASRKKPSKWDSLNQSKSGKCSYRNDKFGLCSLQNMVNMAQ